MLIIFISLLFIINTIRADTVTDPVTVEVCKNVYPFQHNNLQNCDPLVRRNGYDYCPNEGTWGECSKFKCRYHHEEDGGWCRYGKTDHCECCTKYNLKYAYYAIETNGNSGDDANINIWNFNIRLDAGNMYINGTEFEDVYPYECVAPTKMYLSARLTYNDTCATKLEVFINCTLVATITEDDLETAWGFCFLWWDFCVSRTMLEIERESGNNEKVFSLGSYHVDISDEQICSHFEAVNTTGDWNIPLVPMEICETIEIPPDAAEALWDDLTDELGKKIVKHWWMILAIVLIVIISSLIICVIVTIFFVILYLNLKKNKDEEYTKRMKLKDLDMYMDM